MYNGLMENDSLSLDLLTYLLIPTQVTTTVNWTSLVCSSLLSAKIVFAASGSIFIVQTVSGLCAIRPVTTVHWTRGRMKMTKTDSHPTELRPPENASSVEGSPWMKITSMAMKLWAYLVSTKWVQNVEEAYPPGR